MRCTLACSILFLTTHGAFGAGEVQKAQFAADSARLARHGIEPTLAGVLKHLRRLKPNPAVARRTAELIRQLGDDNFRDRESAMRELIKVQPVPLELLRKATMSSDPEVASWKRNVHTVCWSHR